MYGFLADTWWYGLTSRLSEADFAQLAHLRVSQGYTAVQLVAGIPPEIGPLNQNATSAAGFPWTTAGSINQEYLALAAGRTALLNNLGLSVIVYGAWGQQLDWIGAETMSTWWEQIASALEPFDVIYCLTGEPNLLLAQVVQFSNV